MGSFEERFRKLFGRPAPKVPSPEELRQRRAHFQQIVRAPDWELVAEVLGAVPSTLRNLYASGLVLEGDFDVVTGRPEDFESYGIDQFEALRREWREHMWPDLRDGCLTFAGDGFGNHFFLKANTGPDWPVFFYDHEIGGMTLIADSLEAFLGMLQPTQDDEA